MDSVGHREVEEGSVTEEDQREPVLGWGHIYLLSCLGWSHREHLVLLGDSFSQRETKWG